MRKVLLLCCLLIANSCMIDRFYTLSVKNNSNVDIYVIADMNPLDNIITEGSQVDFILPGEAGHFVDRHHWYKLIQDSMYLYVLDAKRMNNVINTSVGYLKEEEITALPSDGIIGRMTILKSQVGCDFAYPAYSDVNWVSYQ